MPPFREPAPAPETLDDLLALAVAVGVLDADDDWRDRALCRETDPEVFYPEVGATSRPAKRVCQGCDVRAQCLAYALAEGERFGVWGGTVGAQRAQLAPAYRRHLRLVSAGEIAVAQ